jgi:hypothetical protein
MVAAVSRISFRALNRARAQHCLQHSLSHRSLNPASHPFLSYDANLSAPQGARPAQEHRRGHHEPASSKPWDTHGCRRQNYSLFQWQGSSNARNPTVAAMRGRTDAACGCERPRIGSFLRAISPEPSTLSRRLTRRMKSPASGCSHTTSPFLCGCARIILRAHVAAAGRVALCQWPSTDQLRRIWTSADQLRPLARSFRALNRARAQHSLHHSNSSVRKVPAHRRHHQSPQRTGVPLLQLFVPRHESLDLLQDVAVKISRWWWPTTIPDTHFRRCRTAISTDGGHRFKLIPDRVSA